MKAGFLIPRAARRLLLRASLVIVIATVVLSICQLYTNPSFMTRKYTTSKEYIRNHGNVGEDIRRLFDTFGEVSITDISDTYQHTPNILAPPNVVYSPNSTQVTLCTQASDNHLNDVQELAKAWKSPISLAIFTTFKRLAYVMHSIVRMRHCDELVRKYVQFHVTFPVVRKTLTLELIPDFEFDCSLNDNITDDQIPNFPTDRTYPGNMLRTIALKYAKTAYVMSLDIDLVPSKDLNAMLQAFLREEDLELPPEDNNKVAYVLPSFETNLKPLTPLTKKELLQLWATEVRPFYFNVCAQCQLYTNYLSWIKMNTTDRMQVAYSVKYQFIWEPFYVARKSGLPMFDAQFKNYGAERDSQTCEMHVAGYTFKVLNNGFVVHRGIKSMANVGHKSFVDNRRNHMLFHQIFYVEMKSRYPDSDRECVGKFGVGKAFRKFNRKRVS